MMVWRSKNNLCFFSDLTIIKYLMRVLMSFWWTQRKSAPSNRAIDPCRATSLCILSVWSPHTRWGGPYRISALSWPRLPGIRLSCSLIPTNHHFPNSPTTGKPGNSTNRDWEIVIFTAGTFWVKHMISGSATLQMKGRWDSNMNVTGSHLFIPRNETVQPSYFQNGIILFCLPIHILICLWEIYIFPGSVSQFCCSQICGPIWEYINRFTDAWMWKLGLRPHNSQKSNTVHKWHFRCSACQPYDFS